MTVSSLAALMLRIILAWIGLSRGTGPQFRLISRFDLCSEWLCPP
jgi:hypothetical protein